MNKQLSQVIIFTLLNLIMYCLAVNELNEVQGNKSLVTTIIFNFKSNTKLSPVVDLEQVHLRFQID